MATNMYGYEYEFVRVSADTYKFVMSEENLTARRMGGIKGESSINMNNLGMFDPPGGPYVAIGSCIYKEEVEDAGEEWKNVVIRRIFMVDDEILVTI